MDDDNEAIDYPDEEEDRRLVYRSMGKIPKQVHRKLMTETRNWKRTIKSLIATKEPVEQMDEQFKVLGRGQIPPSKRVPGRSSDTTAYDDSFQIPATGFTACSLVFTVARSPDLAIEHAQARRRA